MDTNEIETAGVILLALAPVVGLLLLRKTLGVLNAAAWLVTWGAVVLSGEHGGFSLTLSNEPMASSWKVDMGVSTSSWPECTLSSQQVFWRWSLGRCCEKAIELDGTRSCLRSFLEPPLRWWREPRSSRTELRHALSPQACSCIHTSWRWGAHY